MNPKSPASINGGNLQSTLEHSVEAATVAAHRTIDSASEMARPAFDHVVSGAHGAVDRAGVAATHAAATLGVKGEQLNVSTHKIVEHAQGYVREHPVASLGIAVATGYFLSWLLSSR